MNCTFFGHKDCHSNIMPKLKSAVETLIQNNDVNHFYIGNHGNFDKIALNTIIELKRKYPHITYEIVLAYIPSKNPDCPTIYPEGIESTPKRFAICFRNQWMINHSDYIISHITHTFGGAYQFTEIAKRQRKNIINLL